MIDISRALKIEGWMHEAELKWLALQAQRRHSVVEIGCWMGRTTLALADNIQNGHLYAVDTWLGSDEEPHKELLKDKETDWLYKKFLDNVALAGYNIIPVRGTSLEAAAKFVREKLMFDMIFIDASHDYYDVRADIEAYRPLLNKHGLLCGHDYARDRGANGGACRAVDELIRNVQRGPGTIWYAS